MRTYGHSTEKHHAFQTIWRDLLRMSLGAVLLIKGIQFGQHPSDARSLIDNTPLDFMDMYVLHYIIMVQLVGGVLILLGLVTRTAIIFELPILIGALFYSGAAFSTAQALAAVTLGLAIAFLFYGSGNFSVDEYMKRNPNG